MTFRHRKYYFCSVGLLLLVMGLLGIQVDAQVYKWKDEYGQTHYSDTPPEHGGQEVQQKYSGNSNHHDFIIIEIRALFEAKNFAELNRKLTSLYTNSSRNYQAQKRIFTAYKAFELNHPSIQEHIFDSWIQFSPKSYQPYLAKAAFYYYQAWLNRGGGFTVTSIQLKGMKDSFQRAKSALNEVDSLTAEIYLAHVYRMGIAKALSEPFVAKQALKDGLAHHPGNILLYRQYLFNLIPRWGGSLVEMRWFVERAKPKISYSQYQYLSAYVVYEEAEEERFKKNFIKANQLYTKAINMSEGYMFYFARAKESYNAGKHVEALKDFNRAIRLSDENADFYYWRAKNYYYMSKLELAYQDIKIAERLAPIDKYIGKFKQQLMAYIQIPTIPLGTKGEAAVALVDFYDKIYKAPENGELYYQKAKLLLSTNQLTEAQTSLEQAIKYSPKKFDYYQLLDLTLFKQNKLQEILELWAQYLKLRPNDGRAYLERSGTYYHMSNMPLSLKDLEKAVELGNEEAKQRYKSWKNRL